MQAKDERNEGAMKNMRGVIPALISPTGRDGGLNHTALRVLVRFLLDRNVSGMFAGGSSGTAFMLTPDERKRLAEIVVTEVAGQVPVVVHVGAMDIRVAHDLARHASRIGADGVASILPFYYGYGIREIRGYFQTISESELPVLVYLSDKAGRLPCSMEEFSEKVLSLKRVGALKYTGVVPYELWRFTQMAGEGFPVYSGDDRSMLPMLISGSAGAIGTNFSAYPEPFCRLYEAFESGDVRRAMAENDRVLALMTRLTAFPVFGRMSEALRLRGIDVGEPRRPHLRLTGPQRKALRTTLEEYELL